MGIVSMAVVAVMLIGVAAAHPFFGMQGTLSDAEKATLKQTHDAIQTAIENGDYATWKSLMEQQLTEDNFNKIVDANKNRAELKSAMEEAKNSGDYSKVKELMQKYGINGHFGMHEKPKTNQ